MFSEAATAADPRRRFALDVVRQLRDAGHEALWAGGCVRDQLLGVEPKDYDIATSAPPDAVREVFGKRRTIAVGASFGVITVLGPKPAGQIEVATFRTDGGYIDGRRPDAVEFTTAEHDAARRDFTINGLFYDPIAEEVIDFVGGRQDIETGVVRAIGDAEQRFEEDKLRMLRAVRFASTLGFGLEPHTAAAIAAHAEEIELVSSERVGAELRRMLTGPSPGQAVRLMHAVGLLPVVLPELGEIEAERLVVCDKVFRRLTQPTLPAALACLLAPDAEPETIRSAATRLKFTKKEADRAAWLAENYKRLATADEQPWSRVQPLLAHEGGAELVAVYEALRKPDGASRFCHTKLSLPPEKLNPPPLVTGADLIRLGHKPGPVFTALLARARDAQLDGHAATTEEAIRLATRE